jgi:hypothetical protein
VSGFTKLFSSIVTSSIWCLDHIHLRVWITLLALSDALGIVEGSIPGLAHQARVTPDEFRAAIDCFTSPDPDSRTPDHEGRRIEAIAGGWRILNYGRYREKGQAKDGSRAPYYRDYRARQAAAQSNVARNTAQHSGVARNTEAEAEAEAKAGTEQQQQPRARQGAQVRPEEDVEALRQNIAELAELLDISFDRAAIAVTSGQATGKKVCKGTLSFETMSEKHLRRSLLDSNTAISREQRRRSEQ